MTQIYLQYKNTDICLDFYCDCGAEGHFDGYASSQAKCPQCEKVFNIPYSLELEETQAVRHPMKIVLDTDEV